MRQFEIMPRDPNAKGLEFQSSIYEPRGHAHNLICEVYLTEEAEYIKRCLNSYDELLAALEQIMEECKPSRPEWHLNISSEGQRMARAAIAKAKDLPL